MLSDKNIYEIWLQTVLGPGNGKAATVYRMFSSAEEFYNAGYKEWVLCGCFTKRELLAFNSCSIEKSIETYNLCIESGISIVSIWDDEYPELLRQIHNPPLLLYYKGELPTNEEQCIAIVGTRNATPSGAKITQKISSDLAKENIIIVSGGALGIDSAAHRGALSAGGKSIVVLGCGINYDYLSINRPLREEVSKHGAVISEYHPNLKPEKYTFPQRNRIMSGLSIGTLVVEAGAKSGALITADLALEQGRDVFAVPGNVLSDKSKGANELIKNGAIPVTEATDILEQYVYSDGSKKEIEIDLPKPKNIESTQLNKNNTDKRSENKSKKVNIESLKLSDEAKAIYNILTQRDMNIDELCAHIKLPIYVVQGALTELEIENLITTSAGRNYSLS